MPKRIDVPFTPQSLARLLHDFVSGNNEEYTHHDFANWCYEYWNATVHDEIVPHTDLDKTAIEVVSDIDVQWELFLLNTYSSNELRSLDFSIVELPSTWLQGWLNRLVN